MSPFVPPVLKSSLLALLYFFISRAVRSVAVDLSGRRSAPGQEPAPKAAKPKPPRGGRAPTMLVVHAPEARKPRSFRLSGGLEIGRAEACQVRLDDTYASQHPAKLSARDGTGVLADLGSTNGTLVNGEPVRERLLVDGDRITIGSTVLEYRRG